MYNELKLSGELARLNSTAYSSDARTDLIAKGRVLLLEHFGRQRNSALTKANRQPEDFGSSFENAKSFNDACRTFTDDMLFLCAEMATVYGAKPTRDNRASFTTKKLLGNPLYLHALGEMANEIMYPETPWLINELVGEMCSVVTTPKGQTYRAAINSNAVIQWYDATHTSLRSVPQDELYRGEITLNPKPVAAKGVMNFYQMVGNNGNMIETMAALSGGYGAMLMKKFTQAFTAATGDTRYLPADLKKSTYTGDNWATLCQKVAMANRVRRDQLIGWGDFLALRKVLPDNATLASAIMMQMGDEYFRTGYMRSHDGVDLFEVHPTSTPETINTTMTAVFPSDQIIIAARASDRYAPMIMCFEDGGEATIDLTAGPDVLATGRIEVIQTAALEIAPAFASKIGLITDIA